MSNAGTDLDAALLALEVEVFATGSTSTEDDVLFVNLVSKWNASERKSTLAALITRYGRQDFGTQIVNALARSICRDVELKLSCIAGRANRPYGARHGLSRTGRWRRPRR